MKNLIIVNGTINNYEFYLPWVKGYDQIICADGGVTHARKLGLTPTQIVGDLDSASSEDIIFFQEQGIPIQKFSKRKDKTDTHLALEYAFETDPTSITIIGGLGTRFDHSLANIHLLALSLEKKIPAVIINEYNYICMVNNTIELLSENGSIVSLLSFTPKVTGVSTQGLSYPLQDAILFSASSHGISNEIIQTSAKVSIQEGILLIIQARE